VNVALAASAIPAVVVLDENGALVATLASAEMSDSQACPEIDTVYLVVSTSTARIVCVDQSIWPMRKPSRPAS